MKELQMRAWGQIKSACRKVGEGSVALTRRGVSACGNTARTAIAAGKRLTDRGVVLARRGFSAGQRTAVRGVALVRGHRRYSLIAAAAAVMLLVSVVCGSSMALLFSTSNGVVNTFRAARPAVTVSETFENNIKTDINAKNTGNCTCYVRIRLIGYRVNAAGDRIGGPAPIPAFTAGEGWMRVGTSDTYVYTKPVAVGASPATVLNTTPIELADYSELDPAVDPDGGYQVIEVIAEAIQAQPEDAVESAWGATVTDDVITAVG